MWAFDGQENQLAVDCTGEDVKALESSKGYTLDQLFRMANATGRNPKVLNARQRRVVNVIWRKVKREDRDKDIVCDVGKSESRVPHCIGATTCIVPNSQPYRMRTESILTAEQMHCVQGIYKSDFPALAKYAKQKTVLTRDLAGNAFSTTVCMAVVISGLVHLQDSKNEPAPSTPQRKRRRDVSPVSPTKNKRTKAADGGPCSDNPDADKFRVLASLRLGLNVTIGSVYSACELRRRCKGDCAKLKSLSKEMKSGGKLVLV
jgi:hypothetical protein